MPVDARCLLPLRTVDVEIYTTIAYGLQQTFSTVDSVAQLSMVTHAKAVECGLMLGKALPLQVSTNDGGMIRVDAGYHLPLCTVDREDLHHLRLRS
jgi:hypothetical protein